MKKLYLLGDSIRKGYESFVREKLSGEAEVFSPEVNGEFAQYTLRHLNEWAATSGCAGEIDLVHWNNGLWDVLRQYEDECLTPPGVYALMLRRVYKRITLLFPRAKVIFALSTPIIEELYPEPDRFFRKNEDIREYNAVALDVMKELNVDVNDLYTAASKFTADQYSDATHFTAEGYDILAGLIAKTCGSFLRA